MNIRNDGVDSNCRISFNAAISVNSPASINCGQYFSQLNTTLLQDGDYIILLKHKRVSVQRPVCAALQFTCSCIPPMDNQISFSFARVQNALITSPFKGSAIDNVSVLESPI